MALETCFMPNSAAAALQSLRAMRPRVLQTLVTDSSGYGALLDKMEEHQWEGGAGSHAEQIRKIEEILPLDLLVQCFLRLTSFKDMARASTVSRLWRDGIRQSLAYRDKLSFWGWRADDDAVSNLVEEATNLKELDISASGWGCRITDYGLRRISQSKCCGNLISISLWGLTAISDSGVTELVSRAHALKHLNVGGTFITDVCLVAMATLSKQLEVLNLWGCRHVTEQGLLYIVQGCCKLRTINIWGLTISSSCLMGLVKANPRIQLQRSRAEA
ncbi:hypothetical protein O6H91_Y476400 [Diphasiastrum complanatum]|nr:hypothetical protein O6H91_Y476400 [Diphasiastrum complanatum]